MEEKKKRGRPTENPLIYNLRIRLNEETNRILNDYCLQEQIPKTEAVRRGILRLKTEIKKQD